MQRPRRVFFPFSAQKIGAATGELQDFSVGDMVICLRHQSGQAIFCYEIDRANPKREEYTALERDFDGRTEE